MDSLKSGLGDAASAIGDFQPFNPDNKMTGALGGAAGGALLGAGVNGIRHMLGGTGEDATFLGSLLRGGATGAGIGGLGGLAASAFGSDVGGQIGARKLYNASGIDDIPEDKFPDAGMKGQVGDKIRQLGHGAGSAVSQEMTIRDILRAIQNGGLDYNDIGQRMIQNKLSPSQN